MPKRYLLHLRPLALNTEPRTFVLGGIEDEADDGARRAPSSPCPAARRPLLPHHRASPMMRVGSTLEAAFSGQVLVDRASMPPA
jgi:hypothetical protein